MSHRGYNPGRSLLVRAAWLLVEAIFVLNPIVTSYALKRALLRIFGATIGPGVVIKPGAHVKYPWHLSIGRDAWIGERCWIDNFVHVWIGDNACLSQGAYICTGNHDWSTSSMDLVVKPITIGSGAWVAAFARIGPGVRVGPRAVVTLGSVLLSDAVEDGIYRGNPAVLIGSRAVGKKA